MYKITEIILLKPYGDRITKKSWRNYEEPI